MKRTINKYKNGLQHIHYEVPFLKTVCVAYFVKVGSAYERSEMEYGISHFLEHMLFNGSEKFPDYNARDEIMAGLGVYQNAWTWRAETVYHLTTSMRSLGQSFEILHDMVFHPLIDEEKVQKEIGIIQEERLMSENDPSSVLSNEVWSSINHGNTYSHPTIGHENSIAGMNSKKLRSFHKKFYSPGNVILMTYGGVTFEEIEEITSELNESLQPNSFEKFDMSLSDNYRPRFKPEDQILLEKDVQIDYYQKHYRTAAPKTLEDLINLFLFAGILGIGQPSVLNINLLIDRSLVSGYSIGFSQYVDMTHFNFSSRQEPGKSKEVIDIVGNIYKNIIDYIDEETFNWTKNATLGSITRSIEEVDYLTSGGLINIERFNYLTDSDYQIDDLIKQLNSSERKSLISFIEDLFENSVSNDGLVTPKK